MALNDQSLIKQQKTSKIYLHSWITVYNNKHKSNHTKFEQTKQDILNQSATSQSIHTTRQ